MIRIKDKKECCGCNACGDICTQKAITFTTDNEGFWYPEVDLEKCSNCGLCEKVCPMLNVGLLRKDSQKEPIVFGGYHKNITIRFDSTSGGIFSALANAMYKQGGYVSGAVFNEDWSVSNFISNNKKDLPRLRSSKYVESNAEGLYKDIKRLVLSGEKVLACGSPCQMAALRTFLGRDYDNLIIVDFLCRACNSPKVYRRYLDYLEDIHEGKIVYIKAKNKDHGWRSLARKVIFDNGRVYYGEGHDDPFRRGYHGNYFERPSCYDCKFKGLPRIADISLGDFWGIQNADPSLDGNLGTSLIMVNTSKGELYFDGIKSKLDFKQFSLSDILPGNSAAILGGAVKYPPVNREQMFADIDTLRFDEVAARWFPNKDNVQGTKSLRTFGVRAIRYFKYIILHPNQFIRNFYWKHNSHISGKVRISSFCALDLRDDSAIEVRNGVLSIGLKKNEKSRLETRLFMDESSHLIVNGTRNILYNSDIQIFRGARLEMGSGNCNSGLQIVCSEEITIGNNTHFGRDVWIRDNNGGHYIIQPGYTNSAPVHIGDNVWIGSNVVIMKGVTIGEGAVVAANSVVTSNVPPRSMVSGNPAKVVQKDITWVH